MSFSKIYLGQNVESLEVSPRFDGYTGVRLRTDSNSEPIVSGDESGRVLDVICQYATQAIADSIKNQIQGYSYQPYSAGGALLEPAAEIGDGITVGSIYGGLFSQNIAFGRLSTAGISAPGSEDLAHEFGYKGEDGKYASYAALANGTASINGAGLQNGTVTAGKTAFSGTLAQVGTNSSNISVLQGDVYAHSAYFNGTTCNSLQAYQVRARDEMYYMGYLVRLYQVKDTSGVTRGVLGLY